MKIKNNVLVNVKDVTNLIRISYICKRLNNYGKKLHLNQTDLDCIYSICCGYTKMIERVNDYEFKK